MMMEDKTVYSTNGVPLTDVNGNQIVWKRHWAGGSYPVTRVAGFRYTWDEANRMWTREIGLGMGGCASFFILAILLMIRASFLEAASKSKTPSAPPAVELQITGMHGELYVSNDVLEADLSPWLIDWEIIPETVMDCQSPTFDYPEIRYKVFYTYASDTSLLCAVCDPRDCVFPADLEIPTYIHYEIDGEYDWSRGLYEWTNR